MAKEKDKIAKPKVNPPPLSKAVQQALAKTKYKPEPVEKQGFHRPKEYDRLKVGRDFVDWATNNPEALTVPMFAVSIGLHSGIMRNWATECPKFHALFKEGKEQIGINRLNSSMGGVLDNSIYKAHIGNYDVDINEYMREEKTFDANLSKATQESVNEKIVESYGQFHNQLKNLRNNYSSSSDDLNKAPSK